MMNQQETNHRPSFNHYHLFRGDKRNEMSQTLARADINVGVRDLGKAPGPTGEGNLLLRGV
jgi:hypothetical protein